VTLGKSSSNDLGVVYFTSSKLINVRNISDYDIEIIAEFYDSNDAYDLEQELIKDEWENPLLINDHYHRDGVGRWKNPGHSTQTREKIRLARIGQRRSQESIAKQKKSSEGKTLTETHKRNLAISKVGDKNPMFGKIAHNRLQLSAEELIQHKKNLNHQSYLRRMERQGPGPRSHRRKQLSD
jgi:acylphosphatase